MFHGIKMKYMKTVPTYHIIETCNETIRKLLVPVLSLKKVCSCIVSITQASDRDYQWPFEHILHWHGPLLSQSGAHPEKCHVAGLYACRQQVPPNRLQEIISLRCNNYFIYKHSNWL